MRYLCILLLCLFWTQTIIVADSITVTGEARVSVTLVPVRAERLARDMAERDAKRQILLSAYGKPVPEGARLVGELRNVTFSPHEQFEKEGRPMIRVTAHVNSADVGQIRVVVDDRVDVRLDDIVTGLLESQQPLLNGGAHIFWSEEGWLCVGVGFAPLEQGESKARRAAEVAADAKITETIFGVTVTVSETDIESLVDMSGFAELRREVRKITRQEAEGALKLVQTAGGWYTSDWEEVAVVRVVGVPTIQLAGMPGEVQVRDIEMEDEWRDLFWRYPSLLSGGATLAEMDGAVYLLAVGSAPAQSRQTEVVAKADAQRAVLKFANGFTTRTTDDVREELMIVERGLQEEVLRDAEKAIQRLYQEASGVVPGLVSIGRWRSMDGARVYVAFAVGL